MTERQERIAEIRERLAKAQELVERRDGIVAITNTQRADMEYLLAQLDAAQADTRRLTDAVRWALGEEGDFSETPEHLREIIAAGIKAITKGDSAVGRRPIPRLYWWRGELRRKAFAGVSPEATEGTDHG